MMNRHYPDQILALPKFEGPFDAYELQAKHCNILFASYPSGTVIDSHIHETDNIGIITQGELILTMDGKTERISVGSWYHVPANKEHAASFEVETSEIEFWFNEDDMKGSI